MYSSYMSKRQIQSRQYHWCVISGFCHGANDTCALLQFYALKNGSFLLMFQDNLSNPSLRLKQSSSICLGLLDPCADRLSWNVENYHSTLCKPQKSTDLSINGAEMLPLPRNTGSYINESKNEYCFLYVWKKQAAHNNWTMMMMIICNGLETLWSRWT
jgi:hypothetical protein